MPSIRLGGGAGRFAGEHRMSGGGRRKGDRKQREHQNLLLNARQRENGKTAGPDNDDRKQSPVLIQACVFPVISVFTDFGRKPGNTLSDVRGEYPYTQSAPKYIAREAREARDKAKLGQGARATHDTTVL